MKNEKQMEIYLFREFKLFDFSLLQATIVRCELSFNIQKEKKHQNKILSHLHFHGQCGRYENLEH